MITQVDIDAAVKDAFLQYGAFVIQRRAFPDARDGIKYTARQILHAQSRKKLDSEHPRKKSQASIAAATGFSYVHGDTSCYEQIIHMGRPLVERVFLESIKGNSGTPTGASTYSAPRYTEACLSPLMTEMFPLLSKNTLAPQDWAPTYDDADVFPLVLPTLGYTNLVNGSFGSIGVGIMSSIPQFNLREMNAAICDLIDNPNIEIALIPDFASGGILLNPKTTIGSLNRGEGKSALLRGEIVKGRDSQGQYLDVMSLPYGVYTDTVLEELIEAKKKGTVPFTGYKDLSQRGVQIRIYGRNLESLERWLYKNTSVQNHFTIKVGLLIDGKVPKFVPLRTALLEHIKFARTVLRRWYKWEVAKLKADEEIIRGKIHAYSILDEVLAAIRSSANPTAAKALLQSKFNFTKLQAEAIAKIQIIQLTHLDIVKLNEALADNLMEQESYLSVLNTPALFNETLKGFYQKIATKYGDDRRTKIVSNDTWESGQDGVPCDRDFYATFTPDSYIADYQDENNGHFFEVSEEYVLISTQLRAFLRNGRDFKIGNNKWASLVNLRPGEQILTIVPKSLLSRVTAFNYTDTDGSWHTISSRIVSFCATKRGRQMAGKNASVVDYEWQDCQSSNLTS